MPIFEVNGQQYDVDEQYINDFAKENPKAVTRVNQGESLLEISASDYPSYISQTKPQIKEVPGLPSHPIRRNLKMWALRTCLIRKVSNKDIM